MRTIIRRSIPAALTAVVVAGAAVTIPAVAATDDGPGEPTAEQSTEDAQDTDGLPGRFGHRLAHGLEEGELAERLAEELDLDTTTVQDALDAVRSDLATERLEQAVADGRLTQDQADRIAAALADGDLEAARDVLQEVRLAHLESRLAEKVEAGDLTQEEADEILERAEDGEFPGRRGPRGRRGPSGQGGPGGGPGGLGFDGPGGPPAGVADTA